MAANATSEKYKRSGTVDVRVPYEISFSCLELNKAAFPVLFPLGWFCMFSKILKATSRGPLRCFDTVTITVSYEGNQSYYSIKSIYSFHTLM